MATEVIARPGGYSSGLVAYIVSNWPHLSEAGYLPRKSWKLASRWQRDRQGGAQYELPTAYKVDVESGLSRLDPEARRLVELKMEGLSGRAMGVRLDVSYSTALRRVDAAIGELTHILNHGDGEMPKTANNGYYSHDPDKSLPEPSAGEQATVDVFTALDRKLERLPAGWTEIRIKRGIRDSYQIAVVYA